MYIVSRYSKILVALLFSGSAIFLISCKEERLDPTSSFSRVMTQQVDSMVNVEFENGVKQHRIEAALVQYYESIDGSYIEFPKGINLVVFDDSTGNITATVVADYAIRHESEGLWELKGNVIITNLQGQILETEQLFRNLKTKKLYSNVRTKIITKDLTTVGEGFESDDNAIDDFLDFELRNGTGYGYFAAKPNNRVVADTVQVDSTLNQE